MALSVRPISAELAAKAAAELNEDPLRTPSDVAHIKDWLEKQPHLASVKVTDQWLMAFLRGCKFSLEKCKQKLDMYYTMKTMAPDLFQNRDPVDKKTQEILSLGITLPLLNTITPDGYRVYLVRVGAFDPSKYQLVDILKVSFMISDILMQEDDNFVIGGELIFVDLKGVSLSIVSQFTPALAKKVTTSTEKTYPIRQKGTHMIFTHSSIGVGFTLFKSFLSEKTKSRIHVHTAEMEKLHDYIPERLLPTDYNGNAESIQELTAIWKKKVESYRDWFLDQESCKSDESCRPGKPKTSEEMLGIGGSFRKLDYD